MSHSTPRTLPTYRQPTAPTYRQPTAWLAEQRTRPVQRAAALALGSLGMIAYCAATARWELRNEFFWIFLFTGIGAIAGLVGLPRAWRNLTQSFDVTFRVGADGVHWTFGATRGTLLFAHVEEVVLRPERIVLRLKPWGTNEIAAASPGFDDLSQALRSECERAGIRITHGPPPSLGLGGLLLLWLSGAASLISRPHELFAVLMIPVAIAAFVYYLVVLAWPALVIGVVLGLSGWFGAGALARAKMRPALATTA